MKSKKIFVLEDFNFNIPDDFTGHIYDALELLAKYYRDNPEICEQYAEPVENYSGYAEMLAYDYPVATGRIGFHVLDEDGNYQPAVLKLDQ